MDAHRQGHWVPARDQSRMLPGIFNRQSTLISNARRPSASHGPFVSREYDENEMDMDGERVPNPTLERGTSMESAIQDYLHNLGKQLSRAHQSPRQSSSPPHFANDSGHTRQLPVQPTRAQGTGPLRHGFPTSDSRGVDSQPPPPSWAASKPAPLYSGLYSDSDDTTQTHLLSARTQWSDLSSQAVSMAYLPAISDASPAFPYPPMSDQVQLIVASDDATWNEFMRGLGLGVPHV